MSNASFIQTTNAPEGPMGWAPLTVPQASSVAPKDTSVAQTYPYAMGYTNHPSGPVFYGTPTQHQYRPSAGYGHAYPSYAMQAYHAAPVVICNGPCLGAHATAPARNPYQQSNTTDANALIPTLQHDSTYQPSATPTQHAARSSPSQHRSVANYPDPINSSAAYTTPSPTNTESSTSSPNTAASLVRPTPHARCRSKAAEYYQEMSQRGSIHSSTRIVAPVHRAQSMFSFNDVREQAPYANGMGATHQGRVSNDSRSESVVSPVQLQESYSATGHQHSVGSVTGSPSAMQTTEDAMAARHQQQQVKTMPQARNLTLRPLAASTAYRSGTSKHVSASVSPREKMALQPLHNQAPRRMSRHYCHICADVPKGFGASSELERHQETKHPQGGETIKWIAIPHKDIEGDHRTILARSKTKDMIRLAQESTCTSCRHVKYFAREDNAASHLRRCHFNRREQGAKNQNRGGKSGGTEPALQWLKDNHFMIQIRVEGPDKKWLAGPPPPGGRKARHRKASGSSADESSGIEDTPADFAPVLSTPVTYDHQPDMNLCLQPDLNFGQQSLPEFDGDAASFAPTSCNYSVDMSLENMYQFQGVPGFMPRLFGNEVAQYEPLSTTCLWNEGEWQQLVEEEQVVEPDFFGDDFIDWNMSLSFGGSDVTG